MNLFFKDIVKYWNTIRYLRFIQIVGQLQHRLKIWSTRICLSEIEDLSEVEGAWLHPASRHQSMLGSYEFVFLSETHKLVDKDSWNDPNLAKLWLYNLHYFDDLNAVGAEQRYIWHSNLIDRWIKENAIGSGNGWEPYPLSLRIVNWVKWSLADNELESSWLYSLTLQVRYLSRNLETHLLGNHLFANAKALIFAGLFFGGKESESWYQTGLKIVERELSEQVLNDGGNFELSTMYHMIFLEDLLDLVNIHRAYNRELSIEVEGVISTMFDWLDAMCHPDGEISFFNDAAIGITPSVEELHNYRDRLLLSGLSTNDVHNLINLEESGYSRVVIGEAVALIDCASIGPDYIPGHAHADTLSFELSVFGQRVIVNSGTSIYGVGKERLRQRGTAAHSTVVIDGVDSSEVWGGFRVSRRARVFNSKHYDQKEKIELSACHDGYCRLSGQPVHCRKWQFSKNSLLIEDQVTGDDMHEVDVVFPLHPKVEIADIDEGKVFLNVSGKQVEINFDGVGSFYVNKSTYHPNFGISIENNQLIYQVSGKLPLKIITRIHW